MEENSRGNDDDDNDGVKDINDPFPTNPTGAVDTDGDGKPDESLPKPSWFTGRKLKADSDDDNDGVPDDQDAFPLDASEWRDTDGDGVGDNADTDDDDDGLSDAKEKTEGTDPKDADSDGRTPVGPVESRKEVRSLPMVGTLGHLTGRRFTPSRVHGQGEEKETRGRGGRRHYLRHCRVMVFLLMAPINYPKNRKCKKLVLMK
ncbi:MAG: hypothetical protein R6U61_02065 [Thermoplasmata archaeon]